MHNPSVTNDGGNIQNVGLNSQLALHLAEGEGFVGGANNVSATEVSARESVTNSTGLADSTTQDLLKSVWMSNDFAHEETKTPRTESRPITRDILHRGSNKRLSEESAYKAKDTETMIQSKTPKHPSFLTEEKLVQLAATNKTGEVALQKTRNHSTRRHRFEGKLASEEPRVTPSPSILERLRRHKTIRSLSESDRKSFENVFLLRMAAHHLIRLFLLTNDPVLVKGLYQGLLERKRHRNKTKDRRKRFQSAQKGETQRA
jgi:hypothetical protein